MEVIQQHNFYKCFTEALFKTINFYQLTKNQNIQTMHFHKKNRNKINSLKNLWENSVLKGHWRSQSSSLMLFEYTLLLFSWNKETLWMNKVFSHFRELINKIKQMNGNICIRNHNSHFIHNSTLSSNNNEEGNPSG